MRVKKIIGLLVVVMLLAMLFTGCNTSEPTATNEPNESEAEQASEEKTVDFPTKPVKIIVCRGAGGSTDVVARTFQPFFQKYLGVNVVVENIDGAAGRIGLTAASKADPDGYTLVFGNFPSYVLTQHIAGNVDYKMSDFEPIYNVNGGESAAVVVPYDSEYETLEDLVKAAKENPGKINAALPSGLSNSSLGFSILVGATDIDVQRVPYDKGSEALQAVMGKHVDFTVASAINVYQPVADKKVRALAVFNPEEDEKLPGVPTFASIYGEKYSYVSQMGLLAPPNTPEEILEILEDAAAKAVADPEFLANAEDLFSVLPLDSKRLEESIQRSYDIAEEFRPFLEMLVED